MKKLVCKHKKKNGDSAWAIIPYRPVITIFSAGTSGGGGGILNDAIAICTECLEKRYL